MRETRTLEVKAETIQDEEARFKEVSTYDAETGYLVISVFPVLDEEMLKEQSVSITEEMLCLMKESACSGNRKRSRS